MNQKLFLLDTTLRDGDQSPGISLAPLDKLAIARQLQMLGVDIIEAGFPASSRAEMESVKLISSEVRDTHICAFARAKPSDIEAAWSALKEAEYPLLHLTLPTSKINMTQRLEMTEKKILHLVQESVSGARTLFDEIELGAEDATRADPNFLLEYFSAGVEAGATIINIADTVGCMLPWEFGALVRKIAQRIQAVKDGLVRLSVHCHNDLGMATANTLIGIHTGATQVECSLLGLGERGGNAPLEEIVVALHTRKRFFEKKQTRINIEYLFPSCDIVSAITGIIPPANKPIIGRNAFMHSSGMHQDGIIKSRETYQIINPIEFGGSQSNIRLSRHSGRNGFINAISRFLSDHLENDIIEELLYEFKNLADNVRTFSNTELLELLGRFSLYEGGTLKLKKIRIKQQENGLFLAEILIEELCMPLNLKFLSLRTYKAIRKTALDAIFASFKEIMPNGFYIKKFSSSISGMLDKTSACFWLEACLDIDTFYAESFKPDIHTATADAILDAINGARAIAYKNLQKSEMREIL